MEDYGRGLKRVKFIEKQGIKQAESLFFPRPYDTLWTSIVLSVSWG